MRYVTSLIRHTNQSFSCISWLDVLRHPLGTIQEESSIKDLIIVGKVGTLVA